MQQWAAIRRRVLPEGVSKRQIMRETGMHWTTLQKILNHSQPPGYQTKQVRERPKLGPYVGRIRAIIEQDKQIPRKQRHTAKRIFEHLRDEEGLVEGTGGYARRNFLVPVPEVADYDALNAHLLDCCRNDLGRQLRGQTGRKADLLKEEQAAFIALPAAPLDACRKQASRSNTLSLVRFDDNDYSVPVCWAHHEITVKGYWDRVEIYRGVEPLACHPRHWGKGQVVYEPRHYLPLLDRKPGALDHGRPLQGLQLPDSFALLRRRLESDNGHKGTKDYITVLPRQNC